MFYKRFSKIYQCALGRNNNSKFFLKKKMSVIENQQTQNRYFDQRIDEHIVVILLEDLAQKVNESMNILHFVMQVPIALV